MSDQLAMDPFSPEYKLCAWCHEFRPLAQFARRIDAPDGRQAFCDLCIARHRRRKNGAAPGPPARRRSAYDRIAVLLLELEPVVDRPEAVRAWIAHVREELPL